MIKKMPPNAGGSMLGLTSAPIMMSNLFGLS